MLNKTYSQLVSEIFGASSLENLMPLTSMAKYFDKAVSAQFDLNSELHTKIEELKASHINEILDINLKLGQLVDTNYKLLQEVSNK